MYLMDTNICIYFLKNQYPRMSKKLFSLSPSVLYISTITLFELEYGAAKSQWGDRTRLQLSMFLSPFTILPFDTEDAVTAGRIRDELAKQGTPIDPYDIQIAAQALSRSLTLITHNTSEFKRIPNLLIEDWVE